jgi:hypothetical protein
VLAFPTTLRYCNVAGSNKKFRDTGSAYFASSVLEYAYLRQSLNGEYKMRAMKHMLMSAIGVSALLAASQADARLQLTINANGSTFTCFDGQLSCDLSGGANNLLTVDTTVGGAFVEVTLAQSAFGNPDVLQLSSSNIINESGAPITITLLASDTNFVPPVKSILESGSLTFNDAVGSTASMLKFWADGANAQGANPLNTPGTLLDTVTGTPTTNPDSFAGSKFSAFSSGSLFSMTEGATLNLIAGGSITGFNQSMQSAAIPEPSTWAMFIAGFAFLGFVGLKRKRMARFAV